MFQIRHRGRYLMKNGEVADVWGKLSELGPYPWYGDIKGRPDSDGWDNNGRSWHTPDFDLVEKATT